MDYKSTIAGAAAHCLRMSVRPTRPLDCPPRDSNELISLSRRIAGIDVDGSRPILLLLNGDDEDADLLLAASGSGRAVLVVSNAIESNALDHLISSVQPAAVVCNGENNERQGISVSAWNFVGKEVDVFMPAPDASALGTLTSGTTGKPKAFFRSQSGMYRQGVVRYSHFGLNPSDTILVWSGMYFTGAINNFTIAVTKNVTCYWGVRRLIGVESIPEIITRTQASMIPTTPTMLRHMLRESKGTNAFAGVHSINISGEPARPNDIQEFYAENIPDCRLITTWGSTETGTAASGNLSPSLVHHVGPLPVGRAVAGVEISVVDADQKRVAAGVKGRILVRGPHMAVNASRPDHVSRLITIEGSGDSLWLDSLDEGWLDDSGVLFIAGRRDADVKIGGVRVDVRAIEDRILSISGVDEVLVAALNPKEEQSNDVLGVAVVGQKSAIEEVRTLLLSGSTAEQNAFVQQFDSLPKNQSLKTDRRLVLKRMRDGMASVLVDGPKAISDVESVISDCWESVLGITRPPRDAPMVLFGGDSLLRLRIILELERKHGLKIPEAHVGTCHTIAEQAAVAVLVSDLRSSDMLLPLHRCESTIHIACVPGLGGHAWIFESLLKAFNGPFAGYGVDWCHPGLPVGKERWTRLATEIMDSSEGKDVFLLGFSAGCSVAWRIAEACEHIGAPVRGVIAMDGRPACGWRDKALKLRRWRRVRSEKIDSSPVSRHLFQLRRRGERVLRTLTNIPLNCSCLEIRSLENAVHASCWSNLALDREVHQVNSGHLDIVRLPIDQEMCSVVESWMLPRVASPRSEHPATHDRSMG